MVVNVPDCTLGSEHGYTFSLAFCLEDLNKGKTKFAGFMFCWFGFIQGERVILFFFFFFLSTNYHY